MFDRFSFTRLTLFFACFLTTATSFSQYDKGLTLNAWVDTSGIDKLDTANKLEYFTKFKYSLTNTSKKSIYFLDISISMNVSSDSGEGIGLGYWLFFSDSSEQSLYQQAHSHDYLESIDCNRGISMYKIPLTAQDTINHIIELQPQETYTNYFRAYGLMCSDTSVSNPRMQDTVQFTYYRWDTPGRKKVKFTFIYDNTRLKSNKLYGRKIWLGKLKAPLFDENHLHQ